MMQGPFNEVQRAKGDAQQRAVKQVWHILHDAEGYQKYCHLHTCNMHWALLYWDVLRVKTALSANKAYSGTYIGSWRSQHARMCQGRRTLKHAATSDLHLVTYQLLYDSLPLMCFKDSHIGVIQARSMHAKYRQLHMEYPFKSNVVFTGTQQGGRTRDDPAVQFGVHAGAHAEQSLRENIGPGQAGARQRSDDIGQACAAHRGQGTLKQMHGGGFAKPFPN